MSSFTQRPSPRPTIGVTLGCQSLNEPAMHTVPVSLCRNSKRQTQRSDEGVVEVGLPAPDTFEIASGAIEAGTAAALRFEVSGMLGGRAVCVLEHITRLRADLGPDWPQPAGQGCYRVVVTCEPNYTLDLQLLGTDGDHNTAGLKATAMRLVNAVPAVVAAYRAS